MSGEYPMDHTTARISYLRDVAPKTTLPYKIRTAGIIRDNALHSTLGTYNDDAMLTLFVEGRGVYRNRFGTIDIKTGMAGLVLPDSDVGILMADSNEPYIHYYCRFAGAEALKTASRIVKERGTSFFQIDDWQEHADTFRKLESVHRSCSEIAGDRTNPADALLAYLLSSLDTAEMIETKKLTAGCLERYMHEHLAKPANLDEMSKFFGVTKSHMCRAAHVLLGSTILRTWHRYKMEWAKILLMENSFTVSQIARHVGFNDPLYFSKVFKSDTGKSPIAWKKEAGDKSRQ